VAELHPLLEGLDLLCHRYYSVADRSGLFNELFERIRTNWTRYREPDRWPTPDKNWILRVAPKFTQEPNKHFEKQLQKQIAICLENDDWGNDVPTASGLVNSGSRQMNIDLAHRTARGFELVELKISSDTPYEAALQVLRYGAIYMLYRLDPELARRFKFNSMLRAKCVIFEVLAPLQYYTGPEIDLRFLETQLDGDLKMFATRRAACVDLAFRFMAFPPGFTYRPGMDCETLRDAVRRRASPFANEQ